MPISSASGRGLSDLVAAVAAALPEQVSSRPEPAAAPVLRPVRDRASSFTVERDGDVFRVFGATLERLVAKADLANEEAVAYLQQVMEHAGVSDALRRAGAQPGDTVLIGENEFEFS